MNCEKCLAQLDEYLSGDLDSGDCAVVKEHLEICASCLEFSDDLSAILNCCVQTREYLESPPNSQALWLRISNIVECEQKVLIAAGIKTAADPPALKNSLWSRNWQLSTQQATVAVIGIAVITSLLTIVGVQNTFQADASLTQSNLLTSVFGAKKQSAVTSAINENRLERQEMAIEYWNKRVELRKNQWNPRLRDAFERNLHEIDQVVADYRQQLKLNSEDKISEEMLDSALNDKMALLREFAEL